MNKYVALAIDAIVDFIVTAGGAFVAIGGTTFPSTYQLSICVATGLVMAANGVKKTLSAPPA